MSVIETDRLVLREYAMDDAPALHAILSDPETMSFWPEPYDHAGAHAWIERSLKSYAANGFGRWAVVSREEDALVGDCGILRLPIDGVLEYDLGYIIHRDFWRRGFALEAARACRDFGFKEKNLDRLCANMPFDHIASIRVAERIGMSREKEFINKNNRDILTYLYAGHREKPAG